MPEEFEQFAKLYETEEWGQILIVFDTEDGMPRVSTRCHVPGIGVANFKIVLPNNEEGWEQAERMFHAIDEPRAVTLAHFARDDLMGRLN